MTDKLQGNLLVGQSGGPTAVINSSLCGVVQEAMKYEQIQGIFGALHGVEGILREELVDLRREDPGTIELLRHTPSAALGSCRHRLREADYERILAMLEKYNIRYFHYIGGNDSQETSCQISGLAKDRGYDLRVIGIPKTVDNDLEVTDHAPGYGSVARFFALATRDAGLDTEAIGVVDSVKVIETMGRNAGWIAASAALAKAEPDDAPHLVYVPERPLDLDQFAVDVQKVYDRLGYAVVVVCEGVKNAQGESIVASRSALDADAFGHSQLGGVGEFLCTVIKERNKLKARCDKPATIQRVFMLAASPVDVEEAHLVGAMAVRHAVEGRTGFMVTLVREADAPYRCTTGLATLQDAATKEKKLPAHFINAEGNGVTEAFIRYAAPLIGGSLPEYARLKKHRVEAQALPRLDEILDPWGRRMSKAAGVQLKTEEILAVADRVFQHIEGRVLDGDLRGRLTDDLQVLGLTTLRPQVGSLERDPLLASNYYLAADTLVGGTAQPVLLQLAPASAPPSTLFSNPAVTERVQTSSGKEILLHAFPFASCDHENIRLFAQEINPAFLPRPQGALPAIAAGNRHPEISLPAVFEAYRAILQKMNVNLASTVQLSATREMTTDEALAGRDGEDPTAAGHTRVSIRHLYHTGLWAAIRAGWREGYTAEADHFIVSGRNPREISRSVEAVKEAIRQAVGYTKFTTDTSRLFELEADPRHPQAWSDSVVCERFQQLFSKEEQSWILAEFRRPFPINGLTSGFTKEEILRLAVKFGRSLKLNEELFDAIRTAKAPLKFGRNFDFEPSLDEAETLTTAKELFFYMRWLKVRGRPAQLVPPNLGFKKRQAYPEAMESAAGSGIGLMDYCHHKMWNELPPRVQRDFDGKPLDELAVRVAELAAVARYFNATLSIHSGSGKQSEVLGRIGKAAGGRVNYKISGELQLELFDVLSEQPGGSCWRRLYERMVERANRFAAAGAFGPESELAEQYVRMGRGNCLGDSERGRVDGNLFLVFWLGNVVGSRDVDSPDGDRRFFKEKLDELPEDLLQEVRRRNCRYVVWLAEHLRG